MRSAALRLKGKFYLLGFGISYFAVACICLWSAKECVAAGPLDTRSIAVGKYETLRIRVNGGDLTVDWVEFRTLAAEAGLESYDWHPSRQRVLKDLNAGNFAAALSGAQAIIAHNMANPEGHLLAMTVYQQMSMESAADRERGIIDSIVKSNMAAGDGLSAQHAWPTVSKSEEEFIVNMVLDSDTESQTIVLADGRAYDRCTIRTEDGEERILWFKSALQDHPSVASVSLPTR